MRSPDERGTVTAETAVALPALVLVLAVLFGVTRGLGAELAVQDAARVAARAAARGESPAEVARLVAEVAPGGATLAVSRSGGLVEAIVRARVRPLGTVARFLPSIDVAAQAVAADAAAPGSGGAP